MKRKIKCLQKSNIGDTIVNPGGDHWLITDIKSVIGRDYKYFSVKHIRSETGYLIEQILNYRKDSNFPIKIIKNKKI